VSGSLDPQRHGPCRKNDACRKGEEIGILRHFLTGQSKKRGKAYVYVNKLNNQAGFRDATSNSDSWIKPMVGGFQIANPLQLTSQIHPVRLLNSGMSGQNSRSAGKPDQQEIVGVVCNKKGRATTSAPDPWGE
jgi:hypothetical protein